MFQHQRCVKLPAPMPVVKKRAFKEFGFKNSKVTPIVDQIELYVRLGTSDCMSSKGQDGKGVVEEVFYKNQYEHFRLLYFFEPGDVLLDAGANIGTATARQLAVGGRVYAYEPEPENYQMLVKNIRDLNPAFTVDKYELHQKGVHAESGPQTLNYCKHDPSRKYNSKYRHSVVIDHGSGKSVPIECVGIEDLLLRVHPDVNAIKVDIEGPEVPIMEVLTPAMCVNVNKMVV